MSYNVNNSFVFLYICFIFPVHILYKSFINPLGKSIGNPYIGIYHDVIYHTISLNKRTSPLLLQRDSGPLLLKEEGVRSIAIRGRGCTIAIRGRGYPIAIGGEGAPLPLEGRANCH